MKVKNVTYVLVLIIIFSHIFSVAYGNKFKQNNQYGFIENNGQVVDQLNQQNNDVKYIATKSNIKILLKSNSFSYQFQKISANQSVSNFYQLPDNESYNCFFHRIDIEFLNSNQNIVIKPISKSKDYINYYNLKSSNKEGVQSYHYSAIKYINIYSGIDFIFYTDTMKNKFKYDIILHPGSDITDIKLKFVGQDDINLENNIIAIKTSIGNITENIPESYDSEGYKVNVSYHLNDNILSFKAEYDNSKTLTIDPLLRYATYFGSSSNDIGLEISTDLSNNIAITGFTASMDNIATTGAYQTEMRGDNDVIIVKYSSMGARLWSTYFGGTGYDTGHGIAFDANGNIAVGGWTKSTSNIATSGSFQSFHSGGEFDAFIAKFTSSGAREWATYYGGQEDDYINDLMIDGSSDIVCVGRTSSYVNIASLNCSQQDLGGGADAFVVKFSTTGSRKWGTYLGGSGFDVGMEIATDIFNNVAVTGYTQSSNNMASVNSFKTYRSGIWDAFLTKFDKNGKRIWSTYFGGEEEDNGRGVDFDGNGNIYMTGNTFSPDSISTTGVYQTMMTSEESEVFIGKFSSMGSLLWSTYFGGDGEDIGNVATISPWNRITISGTTSSSNGIATNGAHQISIAGPSDAFVSAFLENGQIEFGTYYGGNDNDYAHGVTYNKKGDFLFTGYTASTNDIVTADANQYVYGGSNDAYVAEFSPSIVTDSVFIDRLSGSWCADEVILIPYTIIGNFSANNIFTAQLSNASGRFIDFHNIGQINSRFADTIIARIPKNAINGQKYRIRIVSNEPQCVGHDNGIDLTIYELPLPTITGDTVVCNSTKYLYKTDKSENTEYNWNVLNGLITGATNKDTCNIVWNDNETGTVSLVLTNSESGCKDSINRSINIYTKQKATPIIGATAACPNNEILYTTNKNIQEINYEWIVGNGTITNKISSDSILVVWNKEKMGMIKLFQTSLITGCQDSSSLTVSLYDLPEPIIIGSNTAISQRKSTYKTQPNARYSIKWHVEGGIVSDTTTMNIVEILWGNPGSGKVKLILTDKESGCSDSLEINIIINNTITEVITGDSMVCANNSYMYSSLDTNFSKKWVAFGGNITSSDTIDNIEVLWQTIGAGKISVFRKHRYTGWMDTTELQVEINYIPESIIFGIEDVCESSQDIYFTDASNLYQRKWIVEKGRIIGDNSKDSLIIIWDEIDKSCDSLAIKTNISLVLYDTTTECSNEIIKTVNVHQIPQIELDGDSVVCRNLIYIYNTYKDLNSQLSWTIEGGVIKNNIGDTTMYIDWQSHDFGRIKITESSAYGCSDSLIKNIQIVETPEQPDIVQIGKDLVSSSDSGNQWLLEDNIITGAVNKIYSPTVNGNYQVQITNNKGCQSIKSKVYFYDVNEVDDKNYQNYIGIFPNPTLQFVNLKINSDIYKIINLQILNNVSKVLLNENYNSFENEIKIDLSNFVTGIYYLVASDNSGKKYYMIIVKL